MIFFFFWGGEGLIRLKNHALHNISGNKNVYSMTEFPALGDPISSSLNVSLFFKIFLSPNTSSPNVMPMHFWDPCHVKCNILLV